MWVLMRQQLKAKYDREWYRIKEKVDRELEDLFNSDTFEDKDNYKDYSKFMDTENYLKS